MDAEQTRAKIREVLTTHAKLPVDVASISDDEDLFAAGMTSFSSVNVMLALEDAFDIEFPDSMLNRSVFQSVSAITEALDAIAAAA